MTDIDIKTDRLEKHFFTLNSRHNTLKVINNFINRKPFFQKKSVLLGINIEVKKTQKVALIGPNGSGKSTLIRTLSGMYQKSSGYMHLSGVPNVIFQNCMDINGDSSLSENIELFGILFGISPKVIRGLTNEILEYCELSGSKDVLFKKISLGEQQRLALTTFSYSPGDILLFDESFNILDDYFKSKFEILFRSRLAEKTCLIASHDLPLLEKICDAAVWIDHGKTRMTGKVKDVFDAYKTHLALSRAI